MVSGNCTAVSTPGYTFPTGSNTVTAVYSGGTGFAGSQGTTTFSVLNATTTPTTPAVTASSDNTGYAGSPLAYPGSDVMVTGANGLTKGDGTLSYTYNGSATAPTTAGAYTVVITFTPNDTTDYNTATKTVTWTINPEAITITANNQSVMYGTNDGSLNQGDALSSGSIASGDHITSVTLSTSDGVSTSGNYDATTGVSITPSAATGTGGFNTTNYDITYVPGTLTIGQLGLTITGLNASKTYDGSTTGGITIGGGTLHTPIANDVVSITNGSATFGNANAGSNNLTVNFSGFGLSGADAGNYLLTQPAAIPTGTINALPVTLTGNRAQDGTTVAAASILTVSNKVNSDHLTLSGSATLASAAPGAQNITSFAGLTLSGTSASNYTLTGADGSVTITPASVFVTPSTGALAVNATTLTINGAGFTSTAANDHVTLTGATAGAVTFVSTTQLHVAVTKLIVGSLTAAVTVTGVGNSGAGVQVATVVPVVTSSTTNKLAANATTLTIKGFGFSTTGINNVVTLSSGTVTAVMATATKLTLTVNGLRGGVLTASVAVTVTGASFSSGTPVAVATVAPVVTASTTATLPVNAPVIQIRGSGFDSATPGSNLVTFTSAGGSVTGMVTAATPTLLTVTDLSALPLGVLKASVTTDTVSSGTAVQVDTVVPVVTPNTTPPLAANVTALIINGVGFSATPARNVVTLSGSATGIVTAVNPARTQLTVTVAKLVAGPLTAVVKVSGVSSGTPVTVATVSPVITSITTNRLAANTTALTINGYGFSTTSLVGTNNTLTFSELDGAVTGTVTAAMLNKLTVTLSGTLTGGALSASVVSNGQTSGTAMQVATITPVVNANKTTISANAPSLTISGFGFGTTTLSNNVVTLTGVTGTLTVTGATPASGTTPGTLTVNLAGLAASLPVGNLTATVTTNGASSGTAVQVATVAPVVSSGGANLVASGTTAQALTINGFGFATGTTVTLTGATAGTVTIVSATRLTVSVTNLAAGPITATVKSSGVSSTAVQVGTVTPAITPPVITSLPVTSATVSINGFGFSITPANNVVTFNGVLSGAGGATWRVSAATATKLTVTVLTGSLTVGNLDASVAVSVSGTSYSSGTAVQVATVTPVVTSSTASLAKNATILIIKGHGFDSTTAMNNVVSFSGGVTGTVTAATATQLTVTVTIPSGVSLGSLMASVSTGDVSSGTAVQVATVVAAITAPMVTPSTAPLLNKATSLAITGADFSATAANNVVIFTNSNGVSFTGVVTAATAIKLTVSLTGLSSLLTTGALDASVTTEGVSSGTAVPVAAL